MSEQISSEVSIGTYQLFYVYLYLGSLLFLVFVYFDLMRTKAGNAVSKKDIVMSVKKVNPTNQSGNHLEAPNRFESQVSEKKHTTGGNSNNVTEYENHVKKSSTFEKIPVIPSPRVHYGSFYLRVGCVRKYTFFLRYS